MASVYDDVTKRSSRPIKPAVYTPDPRDPRDPIPQDERKKGRRLAGLTELGKDIAGFAGEGVRKFAKSAEETTRRRGRFVEDVAAGRQPEAGVTGEAAGLSPITPLAGIVAPTNNPYLREIYSQVQQRYPAFWDKLQKEARTVYGYIMPEKYMEGGVGLHQAKKTLFGKPYSDVYITSRFAGNVGGKPALHPEAIPTSVHELTHFAVDPLVKSRAPHHAYETAEQLQQFMRPAFREAAQKYTPLPLWEILQGRGAGMYPSGKSAMHEALAYGAEDVMYPGASRDLGPILEALGVPIR